MQSRVFGMYLWTYPGSALPGDMDWSSDVLVSSKREGISLLSSSINSCTGSIMERVGCAWSGGILSLTSVVNGSGASLAYYFILGRYMTFSLILDWCGHITQVVQVLRMSGIHFNHRDQFGWGSTSVPDTALALVLAEKLPEPFSISVAIGLVIYPSRWHYHSKLPVCCLQVSILVEYFSSHRTARVARVMSFSCIVVSANDYSLINVQ